MSARLDKHKGAYHISGHKIPLLEIEDLTEEEYDIIRETFVNVLHGTVEPLGITPENAVESVDIVIMREAYVHVLSSFGIMCPHPDFNTKYSKNGIRHCDLCSCPVLMPK